MVEKNIFGGEDKIFVGAGALLGITIKQDADIISSVIHYLSQDIDKLVVEDVLLQLSQEGELEEGLRLVNGVLIRVQSEEAIE